MFDLMLVMTWLSLVNNGLGQDFQKSYEPYVTKYVGMELD